MTHRDTEHGPAPHRAFGGAFASGIGTRLAVAAGAGAVLWLCVFWALAR
ncbi:hypothetical protein [Parvibaculum sp.]|mgnify:CR=1 FL=1